MDAQELNDQLDWLFLKVKLSYYRYRWCNSSKNKYRYIQAKERLDTWLENNLDS